MIVFHKDALTKAACSATRTSTAESHVVGAAILASDGQIYTGTNYEANNHRSTLHAEDVAVAKMLSVRNDLEVVALVTVAYDVVDNVPGEFYYTYPCGSCRNLLFHHVSYGTEDEAVVWWESEFKKFSEIYPVASETYLV